MPTYEYECPKCGVFEIEQRISEDSLTICPHCKVKGKESKVERILSAPALSFKGSGFYITDYNNNSKSKSAPSETKTEKKEVKAESTAAAPSAPAKTSTTKE